MAGTPRGSIEHRITSVNQDFERDIFISIVQFLENHPSWTSIASNGGSAGASGAPSTWTYPGGGNVPGENAFVVFRNTGGTDSYHVLVQWSWGNSFGSSPGNPGDHPASFYQGIQMAFDTSGGTSIWNGGTGNIGADSKGSPVWVNDGGQVTVFPRGNGAGGTFNTNKEACASVTWGQSNSRFHIIGDDDYLFLALDGGNNGDYDVCTYLGPFTPDDNVTMSAPPLVMLQQPGALTDSAAIGTTGNTDVDNEGGIIAAVGQAEARIFKCPIHTGWFSTTHQPNGQRAPSSNDVLDIPLLVEDAQGSGSYGNIGKIELVQMAFNIPTHDTNGASTKAFFGNSSDATVHWVVDWDGTTVPGTGATREGIQF